MGEIISRENCNITEAEEYALLLLVYALLFYCYNMHYKNCLLLI